MTRTQIRSPLPGTFYRQSSPGQPAYKSDGDKIAVGDAVGLIEVMKTFTEVTSDVAGHIVVFLVENEEPIMAGDPIVEIETGAE
jgi:acetyl-CoA carboxylase biotin carboxyl carrier protein